MKIFQFITFLAKLQRVQNHCVLGFGGGEFKYLILFDNGLFDKTCEKIKYLIN